MADQVDKLILQVENAEKIKDLTKDLAQYEANLKSLAQQYKNNPIGLANAARADAEMVVDLTSQIKKLENQTRSYGRATLETGRIVQDFAQGGVAGVLNNIEGLVMGLGGPAGLAGVLTAVGVAAYVAAPYIKDFWSSFSGEGRNMLPESTDELKRFTEAIKDNAKWMEEASKKGYLTDDELGEFNRRLAENTQLEKDSAEAKKAKATAERLVAVETKESAKEAKIAAEYLQETLAGKTDDVIESVAVNMRRSSDELKSAAKQWDQVNKDYQAALGSATTTEEKNDVIKFYDKQLDDIKKLTDSVQARIGTDASNLVGEAMLKGNKEAIDKLTDLLKGGTSVYKDVFKDAGEEVERQVNAFFDGVENAQSAKLKDYLDSVKKKFTDEVDRFAKDIAAQTKSIQDGLRREMEKDDEKDAKNAFDHPGQDIIRDVESQDFGRTITDKYGRQKDVAGLGMSKKQVEDAADAAREFQRNFGLDDRSAAQMAIQESIIRNQQQQADKQQQMWARAQALQQQAQAVPNLLDFGNW